MDYLDELTAEAGNALHGGEGGLLLRLVPEPDEAEPFACARLVQHD